MNSRIRALVLPAVALAAAALLAGCSGSTGDAAPGSTDSASASAAPDVTGTVTVLAAASLTETFDTLKTRFEQLHPGVTLTISYGGSDALAQQINSGAPVDVFAAASTTTMGTVVDAGNTAATPTDFATNVLEIAVPTDNPGKVTGITDFTKSDLTIALCADEVPCGAAAAKVFAAEKLTASVDDYEQDVKGVLTKVELGEVDAGLVYRTDVTAAGDKVTGIPFDEASDAVNTYPIALLKDAPNAAAGQAFVDYVLSADGQKVLQAAGFGAAS